MGNLLAASIEKKITPTLNQLERMRQENPELKFYDIQDDVYSKVLVLSDGHESTVIITADVNKFPMQNEFVEIVCRKYGIKKEKIIIGCTRNHHVPNYTVDDEDVPKMKKRDPMTESQLMYERFIHEQTEAAIGEAIENLKSAKIGGSYGDSNINASRDLNTPIGVFDIENLDGYHYPKMLVIVVRDQSEKILAVLINYALRGCTLPTDGKSFGKISADLPGEICQFTSKIGIDGSKGFPVLWVTGGGCDQNAIIQNKIRYLDFDSQGKTILVEDNLPIAATLKVNKRLAMLQGLQIKRVAESITNYVEDYYSFGTTMMVNVSSRVAYKDIQSSIKLQKPQPHPYLSEIQLKMRLVVLCGIAFCGVNGEIYSRTCERIRGVVPCGNVAVFDASFGHRGCIPDEIGDYEDGHASRVSYFDSGKIASDTIVNSFKTMSKQYEQYMNENGLKMEQRIF